MIIITIFFKKIISPDFQDETIIHKGECGEKNRAAAFLQQPVKNHLIVPYGASSHEAGVEWGIDEYPRLSASVHPQTIKATVAAINVKIKRFIFLQRSFQTTDIPAFPSPETPTQHRGQQGSAKT